MRRSSFLFQRSRFPTYPRTTILWPRANSSAGVRTRSSFASAQVSSPRVRQQQTRSIQITMSPNERDRSTLVAPPPVDPSKSAIENVLELTALSPIGPVSRKPCPARYEYLFWSGYLHKHEAAMAPTRSTRHLWRGSHCTMPGSSPTNRSISLHCP